MIEARRGQVEMVARSATSVLFVDQSGEIGGAELSLLDIVRRRAGPQTVCLMQDGPFGERLRAAGVPVIVLETSGVMGVRRRDGLAAIAASAPATISTLRGFADHARRYDVVYANTMKALVVAALSRPLHRRPVIWHLRDLLTPEHFGASLRLGAVGLASVAARCVIANSQATAQAYRDLGGRGRVEIVHNGIDPKPFDAIDGATARARLVAQTGLDPARPIVGVFGRLARWKGQHIALEALAAVPEFQAVIVGGALFGEGDYESELRRRITAHGLADRVHLLGTRDDVPALMKGVDIVAHTSIASEPFGRVIVEAMLAGRPVIATHAGGAVEIVSHGETGLLVEPGDAAGLAEAIKSIDGDRLLALRLARRAGVEARCRFDVERYGREVERIIVDVHIRAGGAR